MNSIRLVGGLITIVCFVLITIVQYHIVLSAAPDYFTLWAVSTALYFVALLITMLGKDS